MYNMELEWKSFKINLNRLHSVLRTVAGPDYVGMTSSDKGLSIHFSKSPGQEYINRVQMELSSLSAESEAARFKKDEDYKLAIEKARLHILVADMATLNPAERKLLMRLPLDNYDKDTLVAKHIQ